MVFEKELDSLEVGEAGSVTMILLLLFSFIVLSWNHFTSVLCGAIPWF